MILDTRGGERHCPVMVLFLLLSRGSHIEVAYGILAYAVPLNQPRGSIPEYEMEYGEDG